MGDRSSSSHPIGPHCIDGGMDSHEWQPLSFVFESQWLGEGGEVRIRQPAIENGRVYCVCMKCQGWTYVVTNWVGYYLGDPDDVIPEELPEGHPRREE